MRRLGVLCIALLALASAACSSREERTEEAGEDARAALKRGSRRDALEALERLRSAQPDTAEAIRVYARLLVAAGEAPEAVWVLEDAVARFDDHELRLALATVLLLVSDAARARDVVEQVPEHAPQYARALMLRARAELKLGKLEAALAAFRDVERYHPDQPGVRLPRIAALLEERRFDEARQAIEEARDATTDDPMVETLRRLEASLHTHEAKEGDVEAATAGLRHLVDEAPEDPGLWRSLFQLLFAQRKIEEARDLAVAALAEDPDRLFLYGLVATVEGALGRREEAEAALDAWIERQPSPTAYAAQARQQGGYDGVDAALAVLDAGLAVFEDDVMLRLARAESLLEAERLDEVEAAIAALRASEADTRQLDLLSARLDLQRGNAEAALRRLERLVPELDDAASQFWLGRALEETGDLVGAERRYSLAMVRNPGDPSGALGSYRLASARGDWRAALFFAQNAARRAPGLRDVWRAVLTALVELGEVARGEEAAQQAVQVFPTDAEIHALHGAALRTAGRYDEALEAIGRGLEHEPGAVSLVAERALVLASNGELEQGISETRAAIQREPEASVLHYVLATLLYQAGRADAADAAVDRALELAPEDLRPLRRRLEFRAATGRYEAARVDAERYLAERSEDAHAHFVFGFVHDRSGRPEAAAASYRRAIEIDPGAHAPLNNLADLLGREGRLDEALEAAQQAYRLSDEDPFVLDTLGWLYLRRGLVDRSISILEQARSVAPGLPDAQLHLALAYREAGRRDEARELLVALRPKAPEPLRAEVDEALATLQ